uniref:Uncharacterized protein n=1 Tax=Siphoviridae sp. ctKcB20 TaxID=2827568 RepID=A0A8S5LLT7_9CAUD|nr:MAG TPA: hypothetical protein [Siphoviridae sp. ctKcB20]DAU29822.1 MAG TPA: hypothetical protein [Caudoviricetes sp.]
MMCYHAKKSMLLRHIPTHNIMLSKTNLCASSR